MVFLELYTESVHRKLKIPALGQKDEDIVRYSLQF